MAVGKAAVLSGLAGLQGGAGMPSGTVTPKELSGLGRQVDANALVGANTQQLISSGKLILKGGKYYMPAPRKKTGNAFWDNFGDTPPTKPLPKGGTYKYSTGDGSKPPMMGDPGEGNNPYGTGNSGGTMRYPGGGSGGRSGGGGLEGLGALAGMGKISAGTVGAPAGGSAPIDVDPPEDPMTPQGMGSAVGGGQELEAPGAPRSGLGNRLPPSLAALLKPKVY